MDNNIIPMKESGKTDAQLVEELSAENRKMRRLLNNAIEEIKNKANRLNEDYNSEYNFKMGMLDAIKILNKYMF